MDLRSRRKRRNSPQKKVSRSRVHVPQKVRAADTDTSSVRPRMVAGHSHTASRKASSHHDLAHSGAGHAHTSRKTDFGGETFFESPEDFEILSSHDHTTRPFEDLSDSQDDYRDDRQDDSIVSRVPVRPSSQKSGFSFSARKDPIVRMHSVRSLLGIAFLFFLVFCLYFFTDLTTVGVFFWLFFVAIFIWRIDSRVSIGLALLCLLFVPVFLVLGSMGYASGKVWAEMIAVWVYLFLVIGVTVQVIEYVRRGERG